MSFPGTRCGVAPLTPGGSLASALDMFRPLTFGPLIQAPKGLVKKLPELKQLNDATSLDLFESDAHGGNKDGACLGRSV
jgi:hypothetical protein